MPPRALPFLSPMLLRHFPATSGSNSTALSRIECATGWHGCSSVSPRSKCGGKPFSGMQRIHLSVRLIGVNVGKRGGAGAAAGERPPGSARGRPRRPRRGQGRWLPCRATVRAALVGAGAVFFFGGLAAVGLAAAARLTAGPGSPSLPPGLAPVRGTQGPTPQSTFVLTRGQAAMSTATSGLRAVRPARHSGHRGTPARGPGQPTVPGHAPGRAATTVRPRQVGHLRHAGHLRHVRHPRPAKRPRGQARPHGQGQRKGHAQRPHHRSRHGRADHGRPNTGA
jgi:hypothetical protein